MPNLFLDPIIFVLPSPSESPDVWANFVEAIQALDEMRLKGWTTIYRLENMDGIPPDAYPSTQHKVPLSKIRVQLQDVQTVFRGLRDKTRIIEDELGLHDILPDKLTHHPSEHLHGRSPALIANYDRLVVLLSLFAYLDCLPSHEQYLITQGLDEGTLITLSVDALLYEFTATAPAHPLPESLRTSFPSCTSPETLRLTGSDIAPRNSLH